MDNNLKAHLNGLTKVLLELVQYIDVEDTNFFLLNSLESDLRKLSLLGQKDVFMRISNDDVSAAFNVTIDEEVFELVDTVCNKTKPRIIKVDVYDEICNEWVNLNYLEKSIFAIQEHVPDFEKRCASSSFKDKLEAYFLKSK